MKLATMHPAFERMKGIVDSIVTHYRTDFTTHDVSHLESIDHSEPFVWFAREGGTHLYSRAGIANEKANGWTGFGKSVQYIGRAEANGSGWYHWNGETFRRVETGAARAMVDRWEADAPPETEENKLARHRRGGW